MPPLNQVKASNEAYHPPHVPVIVVFGGTSGIGLAMTRRLAEQLNGRVHLIVVGRNKVAADKLFATLPTPPSTEPDERRPPKSQLNSPQCTYEFISCDLVLMSNVHQACTEIASRCSRINYIVLASGTAWLGARDETDEGIDKLFALRFYWKFAVINDLLPSLRAAKGRGEAAGVLIVMGDGKGVKVDFEDLGAKKNHRLGVGPMTQGVAYDNLMLAMYAEGNPEIAFTTVYPGAVRTEGALSPKAFSNPFWKFIAWTLEPLRWLLFTPVDVSAEIMVYSLLKGEKGFFQRNTVGDSVGPRDVDYEERDKEVFWEHCLETTRSVAR